LIVIKNAEEWSVDSTHQTCSSFIDPSTSCFLFTIVVKNSTTNKGVPVCFFITDAERIPIIAQWLQWVKEEIPNLAVKKIMIDCSKAEIAAIRQVFGQKVSVLLCHWHIKRDWEKNIKSQIKVNASSIETTQARNYARAMLNHLMYSATEEAYDQQYAIFKQHHEQQYPSFFKYVNGYWHSQRQLWVRAWRPDATYDTNNYIESYHNQLKAFYIERVRNRRVDCVIYILSQVVTSDYRQDALQVQFGIKNFHLTKKEKTKQKQSL
jgi:hypothetical protein